MNRFVLLTLMVLMAVTVLALATGDDAMANQAGCSGVAGPAFGPANCASAYGGPVGCSGVVAATYSSVPYRAPVYRGDVVCDPVTGLCTKVGAAHAPVRRGIFGWRRR